MTPKHPETCLLCSSPATHPCPTCSLALYCTPAHLTTDTTHPLLCSQFLSPPPSPEDINAVLAVHLPSSSPTPRLVRIPITSFSDDTSGISFSEPSIYSLFPDNVTPEAMHCERNRTRDRDTRSMLEIWAAKEGEMNECVKGLAGTREVHHEWRGEVVVMAMTRSRGGMVDPGQYRDVDVVDWSDVVDVVVGWGDDGWRSRVKEVLDQLGATQQGGHAKKDDDVKGKEESSLSVEEEREVKAKDVVIEME